MYLFLRIILCFSLLAASTFVWSQGIPSSNAAFAEKIYIQTDNTVYTTDQTIWFKAIVTDAAYHQPARLSGVLYVELITPSENVVERKLIKLNDGNGDGFFQLNPLYNPGTYQLRAYTEWNKNFGNRFVFTQYLQLFEPVNNFKANPIPLIQLTTKQNNERRLQVRFNPLAIDSLVKKEFTLVLSLDERKDTITIKRNQRNEYLLDYPVTTNSHLATLQMQTSNLSYHTKTVVLDTDYIDFQLFPESGELVHGLPALIGFKAINCYGKGLFVKGEIINSSGKPVASFTSNELGMGKLFLPIVDSSEKYSARIISDKSGAIQPLFSFPLIAARGSVLSVTKKVNVIQVTAISNYQINDSIIVNVSCRGISYYEIKGALKKGMLSFSLPDTTLPEGIIDFTLLTANRIPVAERLYFNEQPSGRLSIKLSCDKEAYIQREKVNVAIETHDSHGNLINSHVSLIAINRDKLGNLLDTRGNILTYFLLGSDLRGTIQNPGYYFTKNENRQYDIDALLLTQGWRKYNRDTSKLSFLPETNLHVSGNVKAGFFNNKSKKDAVLTMMTFGKEKTIQSVSTDSSGKFDFPIDDRYGENLNILLQSANESNKQKNYAITLDKKAVLPILFDHNQSAEKADLVTEEYVKSNMERKQAEDAYTFATEGKTLQEVRVESRILSAAQKKITDRFGKPRTVINGKSIQEKEQKWSYGLYSVLLFSFPDKIKVVRAQDGTLYALAHNPEPTLVVVDGIPVQIEDYGSIPSIPPSEVKSFELIEYAKNFKSFFCEVIPSVPCINAPPQGNIIAIYTHAGKGIYGVQPTVGIMKTTIPVFAAPREFYAPKYESLPPTAWNKPDLRNLIHWAPNINTDTSGKTSLSFYNSDYIGAMQIIVEAISENGEIGYTELRYEVKKKTD